MNYADLHTFASPALLEQALTHPSYNHEHPGAVDNQRLEFLGDAVLQLLVSELLTRRHPEWNEGDLSKARARVVDTVNLARISESLGLPASLRGGRRISNEIARGGKILADVFEAWVAAVYLDAGVERARAVVAPLLAPAIDGLAHDQLKDAKSALQEHLEARGRPRPVYTLTGQSGPDHDRTFTVEVHVDGRLLAVGTGRRKQRAEAEAARMALELLDGGGPTATRTPGGPNDP